METLKEYEGYRRSLFNWNIFGGIVLVLVTISIEVWTKTTHIAIPSIAIYILIVSLNYKKKTRPYAKFKELIKKQITLNEIFQSLPFEKKKEVMKNFTIDDITYEGEK